MTEKIARRGVRVPGEYAADFLDQIQAGAAASRPVVSLPEGELLEAVRSRMLSRAPAYSHQGFPVVDGRGQLKGVVTRRDLLDPEHPGTRRVGELLRRPAAVAYEDSTLREAADHMVREEVGRLPVVSRKEPGKVVGMLTRSDLLSAHRRRLEESDLAEQHLDLRRKLSRGNGSAN
jgi:CBS domain-containing protein